MIVRVPRLPVPARSLTLRLTLAFLLVGVIGAILVAVLLGARARSSFGEYLSAREQEAVVEALGSYYASQGSWDGAAAAISAGLLPSSRGSDFTLIDERRVVVIGSGPFVLGTTVFEVPRSARPVEAGGKVVGHVAFAPPPGAPPPSRDLAAGPAESSFVQRLVWASALSAVGAAFIAFVLGSLLARSLSSPIRELTRATRALAAGQLDQRVVVRSRDEIGELAESFNQMSADLARAIRTRRQMTADLAHDLRTPLTILRGYAEGLQSGRLTGSPALYDIMHGEVVHLQRLVDDLRLLSLADAGALSLNRRAVDPAALLERAGLAHFVQAESRGIALRVEAPDDLPSVAVDTDRIAQVLNNLVANALRHTASGEIVLSGSVDERGVTMRVRDTGDGIAPEDLPHIFDRFYRADPSRQREDGTSSGLGLAIARAIVELHGGTISAESAPGEGTTIFITLPLA